MTTPSIRMHGLDFLRALMMSLGVVLHSAQMYLTMPIVDYYWDTARSPSMDAVLIIINTFRIPVFYLLTGFFTALLFDRRGKFKMLQNRYKRIVVPFLVFLPILAFIMSILRIISRHIMDKGVIGFDLELIDGTGILWNNTHNLWFLYYLIFFIITTWLLIDIWPHIPPRLSKKLKGLTLNRSVYSSYTFLLICLGLATIGGLNHAGRISANLSFIPDIKVYLYFGLCYLIGWILYYRKQDLGELANRWKKYMSIATVLLALGLALYITKNEEDQTTYHIQHFLLSLASGFSVGYYMLAFVGMFSRYFQEYNAWIRYFSDSSYWIFIFHSIPLVCLGLLLHNWNVPAEIKFLLVSIGTIIICIWTYQVFVRNGKIGEILNGRKYKSAPWIKD